MRFLRGLILPIGRVTHDGLRGLLGDWGVPLAMAP